MGFATWLGVATLLSGKMMLFMMLSVPTLFLDPL